jgi:hypothetical protein
MILDRVAGSIATVVSLESTIAPAPAAPFRSSVAFDTATSAEETSGDGTLSLTHTASGSNRAAFAGAGVLGAGSAAHSGVTYDGTSMVEIWDVAASSSQFGNAGYRLAGPNTGAVTVTSTATGLSFALQYLGVVTMTGVDQTTPVGTHAYATTFGSAPGVTVGSVGSDDLVVDHMFAQSGSASAPTVLTDQTGRWAQNDGIDVHSVGSTQPGTAGGEMSWTVPGGGVIVLHGAVAFKPAAAGGAVGRGRRLGFERNRRLFA